MGFRTVLIENRCKCNYEGGYLVCTQRDLTAKIHLSEIESVMFCTPQAYVSAFLLSKLASEKIPVVFCDDRYLPVAQSLPLYGTYNCSARLKTQMEWASVPKKQVWQRIVQDKISRQADVLDYADSKEVANALRRLAREVKSGDSENREAVAAALYFPALFGQGFTRDSGGPINAQLDFGYSILLSKVCRDIVSSGYLTQLGIFHHSSVNEWNLACDFMEPFRPIIDKAVIDLAAEDLDTNTKHALIKVINSTLSFREGNYKVSSIISYYVQDCLAALDQKIPSTQICEYSF